jgi:hypothetical protein
MLYGKKAGFFTKLSRQAKFCFFNIFCPKAYSKKQEFGETKSKQQRQTTPLISPMELFGVVGYCFFHF